MTVRWHPNPVNAMSSARRNSSPNPKGKVEVMIPIDNFFRALGPLLAFECLATEARKVISHYERFTLEAPTIIALGSLS